MIFLFTSLENIVIRKLHEWQYMRWKKYFKFFTQKRTLENKLKCFKFSFAFTLNLVLNLGKWELKKKKKQSNRMKNCGQIIIINIMSQVKVELISSDRSGRLSHATISFFFSFN